MKPVQVDSSMIKTIAYITRQNADGTIDYKLRVMFNSGDVYDYAEVPLDIYNRVISAKSVGKTFNVLVKDGGYDFTKFN